MATCRPMVLGERSKVHKLMEAADSRICIQLENATELAAVVPDFAYNHDKRPSMAPSDPRLCCEAFES